MGRVGGCVVCGEGRWVCCVGRVDGCVVCGEGRWVCSVWGG